jgi:hypothetical protein
MKTSVYQSMGDDELFYSLVDHYVGGTLPSEITSRFEALLQREEYKDKVELFKAAHGKMQLTLEGFFLNEDQTFEVRSLAQGASTMTEEEQSNIEDVGNSSRMSVAMRFVAFLLVIIGIIGGVFWKFMPSFEKKFDALYYLSYESNLLLEDPTGRMDLLTEDLSDIENYFAKYPNLGFKVTLINIPEGWVVKGGTVIDYDFARVATVLYSSKDNSDKMVQFLWQAKPDDLPKAQEGKEGNLVYSAYTSETQNMISYLTEFGVRSVLIGRESAAQMAKYADDK